MYTVADEQFDVDEEELERSMSLGTAEKLRDANAPAMRSLYDAENGFASPRMLSLLSALSMIIASRRDIDAANYFGDSCRGNTLKWN